MGWQEGNFLYASLYSYTMHFMHIKIHSIAIQFIYTYIMHSIFIQLNSITIERILERKLGINQSISFIFNSEVAIQFILYMQFLSVPTEGILAIQFSRILKE